MSDLLAQIHRLRNEKAKKPSFKVGYPSSAEGDNGDIVFRSTEKGLGLYGKVNNEWFKFGDGLRIGRFGAGRKYTNSGKWGKDLEGDTLTIGNKKTTLTPASLKTALSLDNVTNESKETQFTSPTFTGEPITSYIKHSGSQLPIAAEDASDDCVIAATTTGSESHISYSFWYGGASRWSIDHDIDDLTKLSFYGPYTSSTGNYNTQPVALQLHADGTLDTAVTNTYGPEMISSVNNREFTGTNGDWAVHDPTTAGGVAIATASGNDLTVTIGNTSTAIQGVKLTTSYFDTLTAGKTYIVTVHMQAASGSGGHENYYIGLGGAVSSAFSISATANQKYKKEITVSSNADLLIYNTNASATGFNIDNVSIKEKNVPVLSSRNEATITGGEAKAASLNLISDEGDDNGDTWKTNATVLNTYQIQNNVSGSQVTQFQISPNATVANGNTIIYTQLKLNTETAAGSETGKIVVLDSGVFKYRTPAQILTETGANYHFMTHNCDYAGTASAFLPFGGSQTELGTGFAGAGPIDDVQFVAPVAGKLIKLMFQSASAAGSTTAQINVNGSDQANMTSGVICSATTTETLTLNTSGNSFSGGDLVKIKLNPTNAPDEMAITSVWIFDKV
tara:strand:- start:19315 stop:21174 length:1860 start_codon:yes stop_codon:yes gene_type:complete